MHPVEHGALAEWRRHGLLPLAAALGYATCVIHIYGFGVFIEPVASEFGWSRAAVTFGITVTTLIQALLAIPIGLAVDRFGPRPLAVAGVVLTCAAFANLSLSSGTSGNWYLGWTIMSLASLPVQATVWTSAVASRYTVSRGLALAVTLCGASIALIVFPLLGAWLIQGHGWRQAMRLEALVWVLIAWPVVFFLFRAGKADTSGVLPEAPGQPSTSLREGLRSSIFQRLLLVALLFTFGTIGLNVQFPLIIKARGYSPVEAAGVATLIGYGSIPGRLVTGWLLDRLRASLVGAVAFALPALACLILLLGGNSVWMVGLGALFIGFTLGAEVDVLVYLTTRYFGLRSFGALYGGVLAALSLGTAFGPYVAAGVFDATRSYDAFIWASFAMMVAASLTLATLPRPAAQLRKV